ncbi:MAG TPA: VWA domain-containing protein, partial [Thermoanaerobaculia bacterium]|nr:VWA domain-containing protein [Thermoanaerobaculia bacterium]
MIRHSSAVVLSLLLALPPAALPQEAPRGGDEVLFETVDVSVVNVEVFVTDREGKRVTGLTKDDFELYEDGKPVEVSYFYASEGTPGAAGSAAERPEPERLQLAVYLDVEELPDEARPRIVESIERFVASRAKPGDQVMLASYNGPDTLTVRFVPADRPTFAAALKAVADAPKPAPSNSADQRLLQTKQEMAVQAGPDMVGKDSAAAMAALDRADIAMTAASNQLKFRNLARYSLSALTQFLGGLGSLPGRKALLYVSANATFRPGQTIEQTFDRKYGRNMVLDGPLRKQLNDLEEGASSERILFFAMGARDVLQEVVSGAKADPIVTVAGKIDHAQDLMDAAPDAALAKVVEDLDSYYSLGFTPAKREPGKRHRIEVKMKRPGLRVRHTEEYRELTPNARASNRTVAALLLGSTGRGGAIGGVGVQGAAAREDDNPLGIRLQVGQPEAGKG